VRDRGNVSGSVGPARSRGGVGFSRKIALWLLTQSLNSADVRLDRRRRKNDRSRHLPILGTSIYALFIFWSPRPQFKSRAANGKPRARVHLVQRGPRVFFVSAGAATILRRSSGYGRWQRLRHPTIARGVHWGLTNSHRLYCFNCPKFRGSNGSLQNQTKNPAAAANDGYRKLDAACTAGRLSKVAPQEIVEDDLPQNRCLRARLVMADCSRGKDGARFGGGGGLHLQARSPTSRLTSAEPWGHAAMAYSARELGDRPANVFRDIGTLATGLENVDVDALQRRDPSDVRCNRDCQSLCAWPTQAGHDAVASRDPSAVHSAARVADIRS